MAGEDNSIQFMNLKWNRQLQRSAGSFRGGKIEASEMLNKGWRNII